MHSAAPNLSPADRYSECNKFMFSTSFMTLQKDLAYDELRTKSKLMTGKSGCFCNMSSFVYMRSGRNIEKLIIVTAQQIIIYFSLYMCIPINSRGRKHGLVIIVNGKKFQQFSYMFGRPLLFVQYTSTENISVA
jgi:hypothetical protein